MVEELIGGLIPTGFPWPIIEMVDGVFHLLPRHRSEMRALREKLAQQAIRIFIDPALP